MPLYGEKAREYQRNWRRKLKTWFWQYKSTLSCLRCGFSHPASLQFHHHGEKNGNISRMITQGQTPQKIIEEINKCEVICANCHAIEHYEKFFEKTRVLKFEIPTRSNQSKGT